MIVHILLHSNAVAPLPTADATDAVVRSATVTMTSDIVGQYVVSGIGQVLVLDHKVYLDTVVVAPRLAKVSRHVSLGGGRLRLLVLDDFLRAKLRDAFDQLQWDGLGEREADRALLDLVRRKVVFERRN